jgi:ribosomal protein S18 acetylase RimI-like enzyme
MDAATALLDNAVWHALGTTHAVYCEAVPGARRYRPDVSVFAAIDECDAEGWAALATLCGPGNTATLFRADPPDPPPGWQLLHRNSCYQMVLGTLQPIGGHGIRPLTSTDVPSMLELTALTRPGPFLAGTIGLGRYYGVFEGEQLVAMAGERMHLPGYTEISAVCTHPSLREQGLAAKLTLHVARGIRDTGEEAFLHVASTNDRARSVYERLGFTTRRFVEVLVVRTPATASTGPKSRTE